MEYLILSDDISVSLTLLFDEKSNVTDRI